MKTCELTFQRADCVWKCSEKDGEKENNIFFQWSVLIDFEIPFFHLWWVAFSEVLIFSL